MLLYELFNTRQTSNFQYNFVTLNTTLANDREDLKKYRDEHFVDVLTGPISFGNLAKDITVINPVFKQSHSR